MSPNPSALYNARLLESVFDKTGVRSRRGLFARIFTEHYLPRILSSGRLGADGWIADPSASRLTSCSRSAPGRGGSRPALGPAAHWFVLAGAAFVVAEARLVVGKEHLSDEITATAYSGLVEDALEVLLDGVVRDYQLLRDLRSRTALQDQPGHIALA